MITYTAPMWVGLILGFIIGAAAEIWGISHPETLIRLARWEDRLFVNCLSLGWALGTPVLFGLYAAGVGFHWDPRPFYVVGILVGGLIFGVGIALSGYHPGAIWMALGEGRRDAVYALFGAILGAATWTALYQTPVGQWLTTVGNFGNLVIGATNPPGEEYLIPWNGLTPLDLFGISIIYAIGMFLVAYYVPRYKGGLRSCLRANIERRRSPRHLQMTEDTARYLTTGALPYSENSLAKRLNEYYATESNITRLSLLSVAGIVSYTVVAMMFLHQIFGGSDTFSWIAGYLFMPNFQYSQIVFNETGWAPFSDLGTLMGAFFSSIFLTRRFTAFRNLIPPSWAERFGNNPAKRFLGSFGGSFLTVLGARMADGCAAGHILSGLLQMSFSGFEFAAAVFASMLLTGHLVYNRKR